MKQPPDRALTLADLPDVLTLAEGGAALSANPDTIQRWYFG